MTTTEPIIAVDAVSKKYSRGKQTVEVLSKLDLSVQEREFLSLMGPSGSGKTTLLNLLGGIDRPDSGRIVIAGTDITDLNEKQLSVWRARNIGFVFQAYNLMPALTASQNVEVPLLLTQLTRGERDRRVEAALDLVSLTNRGNHKPEELSGGQAQRVAIARAMVADPKILLCDEPTGDLDRDSANQVLELLEASRDAHHKTIVMVTHDPAAAERSSRTLHLNKGELMEAVTQ